MATWHTLESARDEWVDAPLGDDQLEELLEVAKDAVLAYAPALPEVLAPVYPDPVTVTVDTVGVTGTASVERLPGDVLRVDMDLDTTDDTGGYFAVLLSNEEDLQPLNSALVTVAGGPTMRYGDDGYLVRAWDPFPADSLELSIFATPATPDPTPVVDIPTRYRVAQLMQARNVWNSNHATPSGDFDTGTYGLTTYPLDWSVRQVLRPRSLFGGPVG